MGWKLYPGLTRSYEPPLERRGLPARVTVIKRCVASVSVVSNM